MYVATMGCLVSSCLVVSVSDPWDCSFGWWAVTENPDQGDGWVTDGCHVRPLHVMCLLRTAARATNIPLQNLPSRALVLVVQPVYGVHWDEKDFDINKPHEWEPVKQISRQTRGWKMAAMAAVTTIQAASVFANIEHGLVISSSRIVSDPEQCKIRVYVCSNILVTAALEFSTHRGDLGSFFETEIPKLATERGATRVAFITDMDPLSSKIEWGSASLDEDMSEVISDISPTHVEHFSASESCRSVGLAVSLVRPRDLVHVAMQMACSDEYNHIWVTTTKSFLDFRNLSGEPNHDTDW
jgi:hypothetical protein